LLWISNFQSPIGTHFAAYDGNGNVVGLVSANTGTETTRYEYGPFAEPIRVTGPAATLNPFRFSTKRTDPTTDLVLYEYRAYSPTLGRWLSRDPIEESGGLNLLSILHNCPTEGGDPLGLECQASCSCKSVSMTTKTNLAVVFEEDKKLHIGVKIDLAIRTVGNQERCRCTGMDKGIVKAVINGQRLERRFDGEVQQIPCDMPFDLPGAEFESIPWGTELNIALSMQLTVTVVCEGTDGSRAENAITVAIDPPRKLRIRLPPKPGGK